MKDFSKYEQEIRKSPKAGKIMEAADSEEGKRLSRMLDSSELERAVSSGDTEAMKKILAQVLSTPDGQALAKKVKEIMK